MWICFGEMKGNLNYNHPMNRTEINSELTMVTSRMGVSPCDCTGHFHRSYRLPCNIHTVDGIGQFERKEAHNIWEEIINIERKTNTQNNFIKRLKKSRGYEAFEIFTE